MTKKIELPRAFQDDWSVPIYNKDGTPYNPPQLTAEELKKEAEYYRQKATCDWCDHNCNIDGSIEWNRDTGERKLVKTELELPQYKGSLPNVSVPLGKKKK